MIHWPLYTPPTSDGLTNWVPPVSQADGAIDVGRLYLTEVGGYDAERHHELGHILVGGQSQGGMEASKT